MELNECGHAREQEGTRLEDIDPDAAGRWIKISAKVSPRLSCICSYGPYSYGSKALDQDLNDSLPFLSRRNHSAHRQCSVGPQQWQP